MNSDDLADTSMIQQHKSTSKPVNITRHTAEKEEKLTDHVAVEEPLEIRIEGRSVAVTMRTPGHDLELVAGFLLTEGVIDGFDDIQAVAHVDDPSNPKGNTVDTVLASGVVAGRRHAADRALFASSSCGICGKESIDRVVLKAPPLNTSLKVPKRCILRLPESLRKAQDVFNQTGGLHAAALFDSKGQLTVLREDIGRHNAVDKVIGWQLSKEQLPIDNRGLLISGRAGFEITQKALMAGIPMIVSVGAPSSMAVSLATNSGMTLIGFLRNGRFNQYA